MTANKHELNAFLSLLNSQEVAAFLQRDRCCVAIDNYILATAFVFFKRANLTLEEYTGRNIWLALYLVHDAEEDDETRKWGMLPWALGRGACQEALFYCLAAQVFTALLLKPAARI